MKRVIVYSSPFCPYCYMAKKLLRGKDVAFEEVDVMMHPRRRTEMTERAGGRTSVPQIFIGECHVGGYDDMVALDEKGELDPLLREVA